MTDNDVAAALERLVPYPTDVQPDWDDAVRRARRQARVRRIPLFMTAILLAGGLLVAVAVNPFDRGGRASLVERALAAVGEGPVLHVVSLQPPAIDAVINRETGSEQDHVLPETEVWYDPEHGIHYVARLGRLVLRDEFAPSGHVEQLDTYTLLARNYTEALASGRATVVGPGDVDGTPVFWIKISEREARAVTGGEPKVFRYAEEVGVRQDTYRPISVRTTVNGVPDGRPEQRIVTFETLPYKSSDFAAPKAPDEGGLGFLCCSTEPITAAQARSILGRDPLWLGQSFGDLPLARVARLQAKTKPADGDEFTGTLSAVELFYGSLDASGLPDLSQPHVRLLEGTPLNLALTTQATPPEGWAIINGETASTAMRGVSVEIQAGSSNPERAKAREALSGLAPLR